MKAIGALIRHRDGASHPSMNPSTQIKLSSDQIEFYHENGYLALDAITTPEDVAEVRAIYDRLFDAKEGWNTGDQFDLAGTDEAGKKQALAQLLNPHKYAPALREARMWRNAGAIGRQLMGEEFTLTGDHAINKPAGHGVATPWHQDEAYWDPEKKYEMLSIWIPLQPATLLNGCMHFIPGSQKLEVLPHQPIGNDPRVHGLELIPGSADFSRAVACELPAGGATIHASRTLHYTPPNGSNEPRRAYILVGGLPAKPRPMPRRFPWKEIQRTARDQRATEAKTN